MKERMARQLRLPERRKTKKFWQKKKKTFTKNFILPIFYETALLPIFRALCRLLSTKTDYIIFSK
jgi:hypothetical protein